MILIDDRWQDRGGTRDLAGDCQDRLARLGVPSTVTRLPSADFTWIGNGPAGPLLVGVELKTTRDAVDSLTSGRLLGRQLPALVQAHDVRWLLLEGATHTARDGALEVPAGRGAWAPAAGGSRHWLTTDYYASLATVCHCAGVRVWRTASRPDTVTWLAAQYRWWQKRYQDHAGHLRFDPGDPPEAAFLDRPGIVSRVARELHPRIGWKRARALERAFPTLRALLLAAEADWCAVDGIGPAIAREALASVWGATAPRVDSEATPMADSGS